MGHPCPNYIAYEYVCVDEKWPISIMCMDKRRSNLAWWASYEYKEC